MKQNAYKDAGVDVDKAANLISRIKPHTEKTKRSGVASSLGGFGAVFDLKDTGYEDPLLISATDGVGTKLKIAIDLDRHDTVGIDAVAMCVNDLVVQGAEPLFFLDYFATGQLVNDVAESVIKGIAEGCQEAGCALIGGETAEMPGMYMPGDYDIAGFAVGAVEREKLVTGENIKPGDVILGLSSNGIHSNGFSLIRKLIGGTQGYTYDSTSPFDSNLSLGELLLMPTRIYVRSILEALKIEDADGHSAIKGMSHITGGGFNENIPRALPKGTKAVIDAKSWDLPPIFKWMKSIGNVSNIDMSETFNCGIGFAVFCDPEHQDALKASLEKSGEVVQEIGVVADSSDTDAQIEMVNLDEAWA